MSPHVNQRLEACEFTMGITQAAADKYPLPTIKAGNIRN